MTFQNCDSRYSDMDILKMLSKREFKILDMWDSKSRADQGLYLQLDPHPSGVVATLSKKGHLGWEGVAVINIPTSDYAEFVEGPGAKA